MNVYDIANDLSTALKNSEEYQSYQRAKEKLSGNPEHEKIVNQYMKKQMELQTVQMLGQEIPENQIESFNKMTSSLMAIPEIADFFRAQMLFGRMFEEVTKIITESIQMDFGFNR